METIFFKEWFVLNEGLNEKKATVWHASPNSNLFKLKAKGSSHKKQAVNQGKAGVYVAPTYRDAVNWFLSYVVNTKSSKEINLYKYCTVYKCTIPQEILDRSWYSSNWEPEYFIEEDDIKHLQIISRKTENLYDLLRAEKRRSNSDSEFMSNVLDKRIRKSKYYKILSETKENIIQLNLKKKYNFSFSLETIKELFDKFKKNISYSSRDDEGKFEQEIYSLKNIIDSSCLDIINIGNLIFNFLNKTIPEQELIDKIRYILKQSFIKDHLAHDIARIAKENKISDTFPDLYKNLIELSLYF